jgi:alpha-beta hydrolase superfamily lysophospholipase
LKEKGEKQGWKGHIDAKTDVVMDDIELLLRRAEDDGIGEEVPKYLLGHSLGGLMIIYFALTQDLSRLSGLISIGKKMTRQHV